MEPAIARSAATTGPGAAIVGNTINPKAPLWVATPIPAPLSYSAH